MAKARAGRRETRTTDGGTFDGMPWYVRAFAVVGFPAAIAAAVLWWVMVVLNARLDSMEALLSAQVQAIQHVCFAVANTDQEKLSCALTRIELPDERR